MASAITYLIFGVLVLALWRTTKGGSYSLPFGMFGRVGIICLLVFVGFFVPFQPEAHLFWVFLLAIEMVAYMTSGAVAMAANVVVFIGLFSLIMSMVRGI